jgi:hypothetical protein
MTPDPEIPARYRGGNRPLIGRCDHFALKKRTARGRNGQFPGNESRSVIAWMRDDLIKQYDLRNELPASRKRRLTMLQVQGHSLHDFDRHSHF